MPKKITITEVRNGYTEPFVSETDYVFGAGQVSDEILQENGQWIDYLPEGEIQAKQTETSNCTGFGTNNCLEIIARRKYGLKNNWSDRFLGIVAGTRPPGNDPGTVAEALRKKGDVPEDILPFIDNLSVEEYYSFKGGSEAQCKSVANEFLSEYVFKHEWIAPLSNEIPKEALMEALKRSPLGIAVMAWAERNGKYYRPEGMADTHFCVLVGYKENEYWLAYDSYEPFLKKLDWSYPFYTAKRYYFRQKTEEEKRAELSGLLGILKAALNWLALFLPFLKKKEEPVIELPSPPPPPLESPSPEYKWGTKEEARHSVRVICDEEELSWNEKQVISAVINCESGYDIKAKHENKDAQGRVLSTDWGICQYNDYYYIGPGKPIASIDEALNNPEKCVRVMIRQFRNGRLKDWICYRDKKYINFSS